MKNSVGLINPSRLRKIPASFGWVDHQLVHKNYLTRLPPEAMALYLFLLCVADKNGTSYYSDKGIQQKLNIIDVASSRECLIKHNLVAYQFPFYQVLSLEIFSEIRENSDPVNREMISNSLKEWMKNL
jgi:hypothetical protein